MIPPGVHVVGGHVGSDVGLGISLAAEGVLSDDAQHGPGGDFNTVEGQGQGQGEEVDVVKVGLFVVAAVVAILDIVVVIEGAGPHTGEAYILIELHVEGDTGRVIVENGGAAGDVGQGQGLDAHAEGKGGIGNHPVDVGVLHLDRDAVSAHGAAGALAVRAAAAPGLVTDFKEHCAGEGFGRDSVQLKAYAL